MGKHLYGKKSVKKDYGENQRENQLWKTNVYKKRDWKKGKNSVDKRLWERVWKRIYGKILWTKE